MKNKTNELNVDFIGGLGPLTKEEENAISKFLRENKEKIKSKELRGKLTSKKRSSKQLA